MRCFDGEISSMRSLLVAVWDERGEGGRKGGGGENWAMRKMASLGDKEGVVYRAKNDLPPHLKEL